MIAAVGIVAIIVFGLAFRLLSVVPVVSDVAGTACAAIRVMRDKDLDDEVKERNMQKSAVRMVVLFLQITWRVAAALLLTFVSIWLFELAGMITTEIVLDFLFRWEVILAATVIAILINVVHT